MQRLRAIGNFFSEDYPTLIIFLALLLTTVLMGLLTHAWHNHPLWQAIAINVGTDALFAFVTIFGITRVQELKDKRENELANEIVYLDVMLQLKKTMLKLLVELGYADKNALIRKDITYFHDNKIQEAFKELSDDADKIDAFLRGLKDRKQDDINKLFRAKTLVSEGVRTVDTLSKDLRPGPQNGQILKNYKLYEIEDPGAYRKYLTKGVIYQPHYIRDKGGYFKGIKTEVDTVEWPQILGDFKADLMSGMKYLVDIYDACHSGQL